MWSAFTGGLRNTELRHKVRQGGSKNPSEAFTKAVQVEGWWRDHGAPEEYKVVAPATSTNRVSSGVMNIVTDKPLTDTSDTDNGYSSDPTRRRRDLRPFGDRRESGRKVWFQGENRRMGETRMHNGRPQTSTVLAKNVSTEATNTELMILFEQWGTVVEVRRPT